MEFIGTRLKSRFWSVKVGFRVQLVSRGLWAFPKFYSHGALEGFTGFLKAL